jgi:hydrogenase nickel incorporation protein HypB
MEQTLIHIPSPIGFTNGGRNRENRMTTQTLGVNRDVLAERRAAADRFRAEQAGQGTLVVQLLSSPGAGKTALLEATARHWAGKVRMGVLVGDIETDRDMRRLAPLAPTVQITTGGACHLELPLVEKALGRLEGGPFEVLFVEDVGNLVCPASHDVGQHLRVVLLSVTEGDDKPGKYPRAFRTSQALVVSKLDLLPHVPFSVESAAADARRIRPELDVLPLCALTGTGVAEWCDYLEKVRTALTEGRMRT